MSRISGILLVAVSISFICFVIGKGVVGSAKPVERANPPAMLTCADGADDCTVTVVLPDKNEHGFKCPNDNYGTLLFGNFIEDRLDIHFYCAWKIHSTWSYGLNDLALADGRPVELSEVKYVRAVLPGFIEQNIFMGPYDVISTATVCQ